ncbi:MAG: transglycosylase SLT domain-containing protein [Myxococcota bacterium]
MLSNPAKAVLLKYLPGRADDRAFLFLVDAALRSGRGQKIAADGTTTVGELDAIRDEIVARGLPIGFVGIPMWESYLDTEAVSRSCAAGAWQLMPETAVELGLNVADCRIGDQVWTPAPDSVASPESPYRLPDGSCGISACAVDERTDLSRSTIAAIDLLEQYYNAPDLTRNPDRAALTVLAYNTGLGSVRNMVTAVVDPFETLDDCATDGCAHMGRVAAEYVPGSIAAAALATCSAAQVPDSAFSSEARSSVCRSLEEAALLPGTEPVVADAD